jgi:hypothetical protein
MEPKSPAVGPRFERGVRRLVDPVGPVAVLVQPKLPRVQFYPDAPGEPYRPCNGSEGEYFHAMWCEECERDKVMSGQATVEDADKDPDLYCEILNRSFRDEPLPEWTYGEDGQPCCTKFVPRGQPIPYRCERTADLFSGGEPQAA